MATLSFRHYLTSLGLRLVVAGQIDLETSEQLADAIGNAVTSGSCAQVVVDLDDATILDDTGLAVLLAGQNLAAERGVAYAVTNPSELVRIASMTSASVAPQVWPRVA